MAPAFLRYDSFPLFLRRYPGPISNFAFDLFFGKPLLIVEHHEIFRGGYENFNEFIDKINSLAQNISWSNLTDTLGSSYLEKLDDEGRSNVKIFSNKTILKRKPSLIYRIEKNESNPSLISCIKVNSEKITDFHTDKSTISFVLPDSDENIVVIEIFYKNELKAYQNIETGTMNIRKKMRRQMCEFRDNYINKSRIMTLLYTSLLTLLRKVKS